MDEKLLLADDSFYVHIQSCDEGFDYTIYDAATKHEIDGGIISVSDTSIDSIVNEIFIMHDIKAQSLKEVELSCLDVIEDINDSLLASELDDLNERYEDTFLEGTEDAYAIYQLKSSLDNVPLMFMNTQHLQENNLEINKDNYKMVYTGPLPKGVETEELLDQLYTKFNIDIPNDYIARSLSVSDILALRRSGNLSCHYVDSVGFKEIPDFIKKENYLKSAEMSMEDDYGMLDGIINNGSKESSLPEKKPSVLEKLQQESPAPKKGAPKKNIEREI